MPTIRSGCPRIRTNSSSGTCNVSGRLPSVTPIQCRVVRDIYRLWFASPNMAGITWWNLGDGTAYGNEGVAGGGLTDHDFRPKPACKALDQLINHDWRTNLEAKSDANGNVSFRGFHGTYQVEVAAHGRTSKFRLSVGSSDAVKETLTMP